MHETRRQREDREAFEEMYDRYLDVYGTLRHLRDEEKRGLRFAFEAGLKRDREGQEAKRDDA